MNILLDTHVLIWALTGSLWSMLPWAMPAGKR